MDPLAKADLILHPIRLRILVAFSGGTFTVRQLARQLPDVPQTTLYRHINLLAQHGLLAVVAERQVRNTTEKVYAIAEGAARLTPADLARATPSDHMRSFSLFVTSLLSDFARYVESRPHIDVAADSVLYTKATLYLSDDELRDFSQAVLALLEPLLANQPARRRQPRLLATVSLPIPDQPLAEKELL